VLDHKGEERERRGPLGARLAAIERRGPLGARLAAIERRGPLGARLIRPPSRGEERTFRCSLVTYLRGATQ